MPFDSGRVTFTRFHVAGDAPTHVDDAFLSILSESRFRESAPGEGHVGTPDEVEAGFTTGLHLFDTQFTYDKNGYGTPAPGNAHGGMALFALRLDTHKVPADVKKAYKVMNEQAAAQGSPTGFPSKSEKREARETANQQIREELASGKYRKSKIIPVLWDFNAQTLYCGAAGTTVIEHLSRLMRQAFAVELDNLSAGVLAGNLIKSQGKARDYEDLQPSAFTPPPTDTPGPRNQNEEDGPSFRNSALPVLPWIAKSVDLKDYLGNEFLMWLWWHGERDRDTPTIKTQGGTSRGGGEVFVALDKALDMDCAWDLTGKQTLRGDNPTRLPEAADALVTGKWPRKVGMILADAEHQWELTLQGDQFVVSGAALPEIEDVQHARELLERRLELIVALSDTLNALFTAFLDRRGSASWKTDRDAIKKWIKDRRSPQTNRQPAAGLPAPQPALN